jgi:phosphoglycerate dehydrogenase-like enzyme
MGRPKAALVMVPGVEDQLFSPNVRADLEQLVDLAAPRAVNLDDLTDATLGEIEVMVGSWGCTVLDERILSRMPKLQLLVYAAGTVKSTVTAATWDRGVAVTSAAAANAIPVAEFTLAAVVMIAKDVFRIRDRHRDARGREPVAQEGPAGEVGTNGLRVGLIGASHVGRLVIERLSTLDVHVAVADPYLTSVEAAALGAEKKDLDDLCAWADIVSVHAPALPSTQHLLDADRMSRMRDGAWLLNTARGSLVDTEALTRECSAGRLCAFIDTPEPEPVPFDSPLYDLPNVVLTPHIAGSLGNEISRMGELAVAELRRFLRGDPLLYEVRASDLERIA